MAALDAKALFRANVPRNALIDLVEGVRAIRSAAAQHASRLGLQGSAATQLVGYETHKVMESKLKRVADAYNGASQDGGCFPGTELRCHQMLATWGPILIARASIREARALPTSCATRKNGSSLNWPYSKQTEMGFRHPADDPPMFAMILTCRDIEVRGKFHEIAIAAMEADCSGFIFYESADTFIAGYGAPDAMSDGSSGTSPTPPSGPPLPMQLRGDVKKPFEGGEHPKEDGEGRGGGIPS